MEEEVFELSRATNILLSDTSQQTQIKRTFASVPDTELKSWSLRKFWRRRRRAVATAEMD